MRNITKTDAPEFWLDLLKREPHLSYEKLGAEHPDVKNQLKNHMLQNEQFYLCCYCCGCISKEKSHIEHVKSRVQYPKLSMDYTNMLLCCYSEGTDGRTCDKTKKGKELPASLNYQNWQSRFAYTIDGRIKPSKQEDKDAEEAIQLLDLNSQSLVNSRKSVYDRCLNYAQIMGKAYVKQICIDLNDGKLPPYSPMVEYFYNLGHFDEDVVAVT